jgi:segregation and condensation protein B
MMDNGGRESIVEALILASPEPLPARKITEVFEEMSPARVGQAVAVLNERYQQSGACCRIRELAGGYQFYIVPEYAGYVEDLFARRRKMRLTRAALETLAIIAYRQPVTKTDIEHIRGVASDGVLHNLLEKNIIAITGRSETVGRPLQYGTTDEFLKFFGLNRLHDLPSMSEIVEMMAASGPQSQTELGLDDATMRPEAEAKLNIADGTFVPDDSDESEEGMGEAADGVEEAVDDVETGSPEGDDVAREGGNGNGGKPSGVVLDLDSSDRTS